MTTLRQRLGALAAPQLAQPASDTEALVAPASQQRGRGLPLSWQRHLGIQELSVASQPDSIPEESTEPTSSEDNQLWGKLLRLLETPVAVSPVQAEEMQRQQQLYKALPQEPEDAMPEMDAADNDPGMMYHAQEAEDVSHAERAAADQQGLRKQEAAAAQAQHEEYLEDQSVDQDPGADAVEPLTPDPQPWGRGPAWIAAAAVPEHTHDGEVAGSEEQGVPRSEQRLLQAGIVGVPNSGKSTLTNALVGQKVRLVSLHGLRTSLQFICMHALRA